MVNPNIDIRNIYNYPIHSINNFYLIISVVTDVYLVHPVVVEQLLPILPGHEGRGVHGAPVANNQTISFAGLGKFKERVLNLHHGLQKVFLKQKIQPGWQKGTLVKAFLWDFQNKKLYRF